MSTDHIEPGQGQDGSRRDGERPRENAGEASPGRAGVGGESVDVGGVVRTTETTKRFQGLDARIGTEPNEIHIELRAGRPAYISVSEGDLILEGDARRREKHGLGSTTLATWTITEITPETVTGRDVDSGAETTWRRGELERGLVTGAYSTNLTDFEMISVYEVGRRGDDAPRDGAGDESVTVAVVAYGDNGLKYGRRYRFVDGALELVEQDEPLGGFEDAVEERLNQRVREALAADGYAVIG